MTALQNILDHYRSQSQSEREKGTYFEELIRTYFRYEASYADLYSDVWLFADWAKEIGTPQHGISAKDTGIDLVARTQGTGEFHAIQCKCYAADHRVMKADIDSFCTTTNDWSENVEDAVQTFAYELRDPATSKRRSPIAKTLEIRAELVLSHGPFKPFLLSAGV